MGRVKLAPAHENGTPLTLTSAGDVATLVRAHGTRFVVTNKNGDVSPSGARELGLFANDTRFLSHYEVTLPQASLVRLSSDASDPEENRIDLMASGVENSEFLDDPQNFLHVRRTQHVANGFCERIGLVNYRQATVEVDVVVHFAADFADVFEVRGAKRTRRGLLAPPRVTRSGVELSYAGLDGRTYRTSMRFTPSPTKLTGDTATFHLAIEPGRSTAIEIVADPSVEGSAAERPIQVERETIGTFLDDSTRFRSDNALLEEVLRQSTIDLHALSVAVRGQHVIAAGIPWFCCPFGRDTLIAAYQALMLNPKLAASSLRALASFQGEDFDDYTEEEPGKIFHELRFGEMAACNETPHTPYYGTIDATPLFVVVAHATWRVTGDLQLVGDLRRSIRAALAWIDARSDDATRLVSYARTSPRGLDNQGWKDSRAGVSFPNGERAVVPIALAEVQGYCVDAYRRGSELLDAVGDPAAALYRERAATMRELVEERLWLHDEDRFAFAIDGRNRALPTVVSNTGHLLWSRVASRDHARSTAALLMTPASLSAFGIRTLASGQPVFNPMSYHNGTVWPHDNAIVAKGLANYGLMDEACAVFETILAAMAHFEDRRLPELYCGMASSAGEDNALVRYPVACSPQAWAASAPLLLLQAVLGIHFDAPKRTLTIHNPRLPKSIGRFEVQGLRIGDSRVSMRFRRSARHCHVDKLEVSGGPLKTLVEIE